MLLELIFQKYCIVKCDKWEKYGRLLGTIFVRVTENDNKNILTQSCDLKDLKDFKISIGSQELKHDNELKQIEDKTENRHSKQIKIKKQKIQYEYPDNLLNVNDWMLKYTPCVSYDGGTKNTIQYDAISYHPHYLAHFSKYC